MTLTKSSAKLPIKIKVSNYPLKYDNYTGFIIIHKSEKNDKTTLLSDKAIILDHFIGVSTDGLFEAYRNADDNNNMWIRFIGNEEIKPDLNDNSIKSPYHNYILNERTMKLNPENYISMTIGYFLPGAQKKTLSAIYILDNGPSCKQRNSVLGDCSEDDYFLITLDVGGEPEQHANYEVLRQWENERLCGIRKRSFVNCFQWDGQGVEWRKNLKKILNVAGSRISLSRDAEIKRVGHSIKISDEWPVNGVDKFVKVAEFKHDNQDVILTKVSGTRTLQYKPIKLRLKYIDDKIYICTAKLAPEGGITCAIKKRSDTNRYRWEREYGHLRYVMKVVKIYKIKPDAKKQEALFKDLCTNGLFNQWNYIAPCNRLKHKHCGPEQLEYPEIALFRVYEIEGEIDRSNLITYDMYNQTPYWDEFEKLDGFEKSPYRNVMISHPVIPDDEFEKIEHKLNSTLEKHDVIRY